MYSPFYVGILFVTCAFMTLFTADAEKGFVGDRERLWHSLFNHYTKEIAPDGDDGGPVVVKHSLTILNLVSWENNMLSLNLWEALSWNDPRLKWEPGMFNGVTELRIPSRSFWQPDIILVNSVDEYKGFVAGDLNAVVDYNGKVSLYPPRVTKSFCNLNGSLLLKNEEISCTLKYMSWTMSGLDLDLQLMKEPEIYDNLNPTLIMTKISAKRNEVKYECCPEKYIDITYTLKFRQK
ncbi:neuronal acetylcholine receptor subunit alpha-6-like [Mercenaria mercenaria]|uniref:neuronal acetylcholine receptor subunit alpha-6-like n=1 Tax=Mercenaria mercenaria TaxID=6596 RepID=UPI00234E4A75|nr:neuronal acetylcholine receptor subunit alpha-6-like [Mercenaria mercenaria]